MGRNRLALPPTTRPSIALRSIAPWSIALLAIAWSSSSHAGVLVSQNVAARYGLTRAWYAQIGSPQATGPVEYIAQESGTLFVQTTQGLLFSINAETGRNLWSAQVGPRNHQSTQPAANDQYVAAVNGSMLYVFDRSTGRLLWQRQLSGSPGAGPAMSSTHLFVPMIAGAIEGFKLETGSKQQPWVYKSAGHVLLPPVTTGQTLSWTTQKGFFYVADPDAGGIRFRLETRSAIQSRPGYWTPNLYAASSDGYLYAVNEANGKIAWKFSVGDGLYQSPVPLEDKVFVISELGEMLCLDAKTSRLLWNAPKLAQFISASPKRVYVFDQVNRLAILDIETGVRLGSMPLEGVTRKLVNTQTDRIIVANEAGVLQCFREIELKSPSLHTPPPPPAPPELKAKVKDPSQTPKAKSADGSTEDQPSEDAMEEDAATGDEPAMEEEKTDKPAGDADDPFE